MARKSKAATEETEVAETTAAEPLFDAEDDDDDIDKVSADTSVADELSSDDEDLDDEDAEIEAALAAPAFVPTRTLKHFFTAEEIEAFRVEREEGDAKVDDLQKELDEHKEAASKLKKAIDVHNDNGMKLSRRIRFKCEMRSVSIEERKEYDIRADSPTKGTLMMVTYRLDTNEPIDWRELRGAERQASLFDDAPANTPLDGSTEVRESAH